LEGEVKPGEELLLPVAEDGRKELSDALSSIGVRVTRVVAYRSVRAEVDSASLEELFASPPHVALFGSPRTLEAFLELSGERGRALLSSARRVAIGPTTASALERHGLPAHAVAPRPTSEGLLEAAIDALRG
jgi:uroporphyrinogen-III synthase